MPRLLAKAEIVEIRGSDAIAFAHAQFCSDVRALGELEWQMAAWLDAQGRARFVFVLLRVDSDGLLVWLPRRDAREFAAQLQRFVLRAKVRITALPDFHLLDDESRLPGTRQVVAVTDGWLLSLPGPSPRTARLSRDAGGLLPDKPAFEAWQVADVMAALPWLEAGVGGQFTPQALGLDRLDAISMDKGCYPGQEVVARLHFRGGNKRACVRLQADAGAAPPAGQVVLETSSATQAGTILYAASTQPDGFCALVVLSNSLQSGAGLQLEGNTGIGLTLHQLSQAVED